jgi:site-specific recombinase XerD
VELDQNATDIAPVSAQIATVEPSTLEAAAEAIRLKGKAKADSTTSAYTRRWETFTDWCGRQDPQLDPLPAAETTAAMFVGYLSLQGCSPSTAYGYTAAIGHHHKRAGHPSPFLSVDVQEVIEGHVREAGAAPSQVAALQTAHIRRVIDAMDMTKLADARDKAMILLAYAGAFRRSELVAIDVAHIKHDDGKGCKVWLPKSKADQRGHGQWRFIRYGTRRETCPVTALNEWLARSGVTSGKVFRAINRHDQVWGDGLTPQVYATVVKHRVRAAGLDPAAFSGHSTRRGFATEAAEQKKSRQQIMKDGGWSSNAVDAYIMPVDGYDEAVSGSLGL